MTEPRRLTMRERRAARPITGLGTWRLGLAFMGVACGMVALDMVIPYYHRSTDPDRVAAFALPVCVVLVCWSFAYGRWVLRKLSERRARRRKAE